MEKKQRRIQGDCKKNVTSHCWTGYSSVSVVGTLEGALVEIMSLDAILT